MEENKEEKFRPVKNPLHYAGIYSLLTYSWISGLVYLGAKKTLEPEDIYPLPDHLESEKIFNLAISAWKQEQILAKQHSRAPKLWNALFSVYKKELIFAGFCICPYIAICVLQPLFVSHILEIVSTGHTEFLGIQSGVGLVLLLGAISIIGILSFNQAFYFLSKCGIYFKISVVSMIFSKSLLLSSASKSANTSGEIITLMSSDSERVWIMFLFFNWLWAGPVLAIISLALLIVNVGLSALAGFGTLLLVYYFQVKLGNLAGAARRRCVKCTEERVKVTNEMLQGIRVVKLYAWEEPIEKRIADIRAQEIKELRHFHLLRAFNAALMYLGPVLVAFALFICLVLSGGVLTVPLVYSTYALLNVLRLPFSLTPQAYAALAEAKVSFERLSKFFNLENLENLEWNIQSDDSVKKDFSVSIEDKTDISDKANLSSEADNLEVNITGVDFYWDTRVKLDSGEASPILKNINLQIRKGDFIAVVGNVGSGKSSLLSAILGEMNKKNGTQFTKGKIAYISQEHWIQNSKLIDNIRFGSNMDDKKYISVLDASQLSQDLLNLPNGDYTSIGERGINLSGGQKARVSIGRALYGSDADLVLVDDALAAVDVHVGKALFRDAFEGMLKDKARVVVLSSNYHLLRKFDKIIVMIDGEIAKMGTYDEVINDFPQFSSGSLEKSLSSSSSLSNLSSISSTQNSDMVASNSIYEKNKEEILNKRSITSSSIITAEDRERGEVSVSTYTNYFSASLSGSGSAGACLYIGILLLFLISQGGRVFGDIWIGLWATEVKNQDKVNYSFLTWYCVIVGVTCLLVMYRSYFFIDTSLKASFNIHSITLKSVLKAPINNYFDITPVGRILNRFSRDMDSMDSLLPENFLQNLQNVSQVISIAIMCIISTPYFILVMIPFIILFYFIQTLFSRSSRELKRIESISKSPIYSVFGEVLQGLTTIRAYKKTQEFQKYFFNICNTNTQHFFAFWIVNRWLAIRLDFLGVCMIFFVAILAVGISSSGVKVDSNLLGMALVYSLQLTGLLQWSVRVTIETENNMTSVERLLAFTKIPAEATNPIFVPAKSDIPSKESDSLSSSSISDERSSLSSAQIELVNQSNNLKNSWPSVGKINLKDLQLRYRDNLDLVLKGVNCEVPGGAKCGIVGRTAAGKSSLTLALFRIVEPAGGDILIDDVSILNMNLTQLRSSITIIPQDPVMFSGSIRYNLDPFGMYTDDQVWEALERSQLKADILDKFPDKLNHVITERGENISVGQKQLICIARALLRNSVIIIMDEATASVDSETDGKIQETIRKEFKNCTVLTIAHRLETIADYDLVVVMDHGQVAEFDSPANLLSSSNSEYTMFKDLVDELGAERKENFIKMTKKI